MLTQLLRSSFWVVVWSVVVKIFGFFREVTIASIFGASNNADVIHVAFKIPHFFRRIFAEGPLLNAFVPTFNQYIQQDKKKANEFANSIFWIFSLFGLIVVLLVELNTEKFVKCFAFGFAHNKYKMQAAMSLCKISTPYLLCVVIFGFLGSVLNAYKKFIVFTVSPIILSSCIIIAGIISYYLKLTIYNCQLVFMYTFLIGGILQIIL